MPNWSEKVFIISKIKNTALWTCVIHDLNGEEIIGTFYENKLQKINQKEFRIEKVLQKKGHKLYVKWKGCNNSFNSWIDKKDLVCFYRIQFSLYKMSQYFPKPYDPFSGDINVKVNLSNYVTKADV